MRRVFAPWLILAVPLAVFGQQPAGRKTKEWETRQPEAVHAPALAFGAQLQKHASERLLNWAEPYAKKDLREKPLDPRGTMAVVDERFSQATDEARDAVTFLAFYLAYREEDFEQRMTASRLRDIDRDTIEITRQLQVIWKNEQNRSASPMQGLSQEQRLAIDEQVRSMESRLRELADERQIKSAQLNASRKKVDALLRLLAAVHPRMNGIDPVILKSVE